MKQKTNALVEKLACKDLTFGQRILIKDKNVIDYVVFSDVSMLSGITIKSLKERYKYEILGHPITLQTVLMREEVIGSFELKEIIFDIWWKWNKCGLDKSLQEIIAESGYKEKWETIQIKTGMTGTDLVKKIVLKNPDAQNLINYLLTIFG